MTLDQPEILGSARLGLVTWQRGGVAVCVSAAAVPVPPRAGAARGAQRGAGEAALPAAPDAARCWPSGSGN